MAQVPLGIMGLFRPWKQAGINYFLMNDTLISAFSHSKHAVYTSGPLCAPQQGAEKHDREIQYNKSIVVSPEKDISLIEEWIVPKSIRNEQTVGNQKIPLLPLEKWPPGWKALLENTPKNPRILWTYEELGHDLGGKPNPNHRKMLQQLLSDMVLSKGSHAFWPLCLFPDTLTQFENAQLFISGVHTIEPDWVVFMTDKTPELLGLPSLRLFVPEIFWGRYVLLTQHIDALIQHESRYNQLISFLKKHIHGRLGR